VADKLREVIRLHVEIIRTMLSVLDEADQVEIMRIVTSDVPSTVAALGPLLPETSPLDDLVAKYSAELRREITYTHWDNDQRAMLKLALKWFLKAAGRPSEKR
jgi:hypothetical protein